MGAAALPAGAVRLVTLDRHVASSLQTDSSQVYTHGMECGCYWDISIVEEIVGAQPVGAESDGHHHTTAIASLLQPKRPKRKQPRRRSVKDCRQGRHTYCVWCGCSKLSPAPCDLHSQGN